ncbi:MAG: hypothetical protein J6Y94_09250 [Bacteriovoracaceae bacterium]|nr:hypothetical protein [Bacteriovoracaceae bacterium]
MLVCWAAGFLVPAPALAADEGRCAVLLLRWANAETMNDFWREIKSDQVLEERPSRKFLTWVMASALRIDREKVIEEWQRTVQEEFVHTWKHRAWQDDYRFYRLMGEIIYALETSVAAEHQHLVQKLQQAHAMGMLLGVRDALNDLIQEKEQMISLHQAQMRDQSSLSTLRGTNMIEASFSQRVREIFQVFNSLIPNRILDPAQALAVVQSIQEKVLPLALKWETEEMIFQVLAAKLQETPAPNS